MVPADADVTDPHTVFVLKNDSIVEVEGLVPGEDTLVEVKRNGVVVGSVDSPASIGGTLIINHDLCWDGFTPQILPGDVVEVTTAGGVDTVPVSDIHVEQGPVLVGDSFTIKGRVVGPRIPAGQLQVEARTNDPIRFRPLAPNLAPDDDEVRGEISYDGPATGVFTATFTGLNADQQAAVANFGEFFVTHAPAANEMTMATEGTGSPGPGCLPTARHAVTGVSQAVINRANRRSPLTVSGMTLDATAVSVSLRDRDTVVTQETAPTPEAGVQTWTTTFPAARLRQLDGNIRVVGTYTSGGVALNGATMTVLKDLVRPARPSASPGAGKFVRRQAISLSAGPGEQVRYTLGNGRQAAPTATRGSVYNGRQIRVTANQTLKAVAVDPAGNVSRVLRQRYVIGARPAAPRLRRALSGARGGRDTAVARWRAPVGSQVTGYRVLALKLRRNGSVARQVQSRVLRPRVRSHRMRLRAGRYRFRVRAVNGVGNSRWSPRSNVVRSR